MKSGRILLNLLGVAMLLQIVLGIAFWTGHLHQFVDVHRTIGVAFVLIFLAIAIRAIVQRAHVKLGAFAIVWGLVIVALGFSQIAILPGPHHWIVRVVHLAVGIAAMPIAERLTKPLTNASTTLGSLRKVGA